MDDPFREELLGDLGDRREQVLVVVGAGVSMSASGGNDLASWPGLLHHGVNYCRAAGADSEWARLWHAHIDRKKVNDLILAAGEISHELRRRKVYGRWLKKTVGSLELEDPSVIEALNRFEVPIWTTNYDNLIEKGTRRERVTRRDLERFLEVAEATLPVCCTCTGTTWNPKRSCSA